MTSETIMEGVKKVLDKYPKARDSYNWLWYWYCVEQGIKLYVPFEVLDKGKIPSVESITRAARKLWEQARQQETYNSAIMPSPAVQAQRKENEHRVREWATKDHKYMGEGGIYA